MLEGKKSEKADAVLVKKYKKLMPLYKSGILEDIAIERDIDATIFGYGATFIPEYRAFKQALRETPWFNDLIKTGKVSGWTD